MRARSRPHLLSISLILIASFGLASCGGAGEGELTSGRPAPSLTPEERRADVAWLLELVRTSYPFVEAIEHERGLPAFFAQEERFLAAAEEAEDDAAFMDVIREILQALEQGTGHCDVVAPDPGADEALRRAHMRAFSLSEEAFALQGYWWEQLSKSRRFTHASLPTLYREGRYVVARDTTIGTRLVPAGAAIERVDGLPVDEYVLGLHDRIWLRWDAHLAKNYSHHSPFLVAGDTSREAWDVSFLHPDGSRSELRLPKEAGYEPPPGMKQPDKNVVVAELDEKSAYVKVRVFLPTWERGADFEQISAFLEASAGRYETLIIDIRGNLGGAPTFWEELFVERLIDEPLLVDKHSIVRKALFERLGPRLGDFKEVFGAEVELGESQRLESSAWPWEELPSYLDASEFVMLNNRRRYEPRDRLPFDGDIYLLVDHDVFSAAEDFAKFAKESGFATLVGAHTIGGAALAFPPWTFELPHSHVLVSLELDMAFNEDGRVNEIWGTMPDVVLAGSAFPTSYPEGYDVAALRADPWIAWVLEDAERRRRLTAVSKGEERALMASTAPRPWQNGGGESLPAPPPLEGQNAL